MYKDLTKDEINGTNVFVSAKELVARTGVSRSTLYYHIITNQINALRFRNRTYFKPEDAAEYEALFKKGLLGKAS